MANYAPALSGFMLSKNPHLDYIDEESSVADTVTSIMKTPLAEQIYQWAPDSSLAKAIAAEELWVLRWFHIPKLGAIGETFQGILSHDLPSCVQNQLIMADTVHELFEPYPYAHLSMNKFLMVNTQPLALFHTMSQSDPCEFSMDEFTTPTEAMLALRHDELWGFIYHPTSHHYIARDPAVYTADYKRLHHHITHLKDQS